MKRELPDPTWERVGFVKPPDVLRSGRGVGIVVIDTISPHHLLRHLKERLKYVTVHHDLSVTSQDIAFDELYDEGSDKGEHGIMSILTLAHEPFELKGRIHMGIAPAAFLIVLNHGAFKAGEGDRLKRGIDWILERKEEWNIRIIVSMGWHALDKSVYLKPTRENTTVQALEAAVEAGVLIVCSNGNTRLGNIMPPIDYVAVGGYNDRGQANRQLHVLYPDEPYGRNGDGHVRPDVLAPRVYLTLPFCEAKPKKSIVSYYSGTSGASILVAGIAACILSEYPHLKPETLKGVLVAYGDPLAGYENPAPRVHASNVLRALRKGKMALPSVQMKATSAVYITDPYVAIQSVDDIERGLALTMLVQRNAYSREELWALTADGSSTVRKIAVATLHKPHCEQERQRFWEQLEAEEEGGVRGWYAYGLLQDATEMELAKWVKWATDINWTVRWCVSEYTARYPETLPQLEKTHNPDEVPVKAMPLLRWYAERNSTKLDQ
jgi:serine protease AprX